MNKVILVGRLTKDPELRFAAGSGTGICRFTVAVNRPVKKDSPKESDFIGCVAFGKTAEIIAQYLTKGREIAISGSIRTGSYEAKDGTKRYTTEVAVETFDFIGSGSGKNTQPQQNNQNQPQFTEDTYSVDEGDMPF